MTTYLLVAVVLIAYLYVYFFVWDRRGRGRRGRREGYAEEGGEEETTAADVAATDADLVCLVSSEDGERYCVRNRGDKRTREAVDLLARVVGRLQEFVDALREKYPHNTDVARLHRNFDRTAISETLPDSTFEAVTTNKGEEIEFCLLRDVRAGGRNAELIDEHTLTFVALHEITHVMCAEENHPPLFWAQFRFLLKEASEMGMHEPRDYADSPVKYCGRDINESPYFREKTAKKEKAGDDDDDEYVP